MYTYRQGSLRFFNNDPTDHEDLNTNCDPQMYDYEADDGDWQGSYSSARRCLYNRDSYEYVFEYAKKFFDAYKSENKIFMLHFMDMHEGTSEAIRYLDKPLAKFLKEMESDDTSIIVFSDHGMHLHGTLQKLNNSQTAVEVFNPFIVTTNIKGLTEEQEENLEANT